MLTDPKNNDFILLETEEEAFAAFRARLITEEPVYVRRIMPHNAPCLGVIFIEKKFIRAPRDEHKVKMMLEFLGGNE